MAGEVAAAVSEWTAGAGYGGKVKGLSGGQLVSTLAALLQSLHTLPFLQRAGGMQEGQAYPFASKLGGGQVTASTVNKAYLKALRFVHPDKLPPGDGASMQMRLMSQAAFDTLATLHQAMRAAQG